MFFLVCPYLRACFGSCVNFGTMFFVLFICINVWPKLEWDELCICIYTIPAPSTGCF